ncbi:MAG: hypothetical protein GF333_04420 [Candidatus Omnitrophica bacterium]|nr:hypothetical protein [Candidatus Omnitrophota bacterium]
MFPYVTGIKIAVLALLCYHKCVFDKEKNKIEKELLRFTRSLDRTYRLKKASPLLSRSITEFVTRPGKRVRPILFLAGYKGFTRRRPKGLYTSALCVEFLHDFMLIHDDIIDKSSTRRGKPSMHMKLNRHLRNLKGLKFNGQDLAIVIGDVIYAMGIDAFLAVHEDPTRKERALRKFIHAAVYTGSGEFIELVQGIKPIDRITKEEIYRIYDYKTAYYTFSCPLSAGAILAGASSVQTDILFRFGQYLGRAFQIKDDIIGIFADEKKIGKSTLTDLQEAKKTLLIWHAYRNSGASGKKEIRDVFEKKKVTAADLKRIRLVMEESGGLQKSIEEIRSLQSKAEKLLDKSNIAGSAQRFLRNYSLSILRI